MKKQRLSTFYSNNKTEMYKYLTQELSTPPVWKNFNLTCSELLKLLLSVDILIELKIAIKAQREVNYRATNRGIQLKVIKENTV